MRFPDRAPYHAVAAHWGARPKQASQRGQPPLTLRRRANLKRNLLNHSRDPVNGLSKLGKEGNLEAAAALGEFYFRQEHPLTYKLSFEWNEWAARRGDAGSQGRLATIYHEGLGVERNPQRAFAFWLLAAKQGHSGARAMSG
ncbi:sel1 repeat family protein [Sinorhizobium medicae]|nr:sel1 repeat family protein [Sinorhizobium medicae]MDX0915694.1 sel1 repeat family protein [Sinorhizobium medicae]MDX0957581.1 sel1 repeat family protein [Sinorhizobium medicae]